MNMKRTWFALVVSVTALLVGCASYPPPLSPMKGQAAAQQEADAKDCDHQLNSAARSARLMFAGGWGAWSEKERDDYVACMKGKGYTPTASK